MGLDINISIIVGLPLTELGAIEEQRESVALTNALGQELGRKANLIRQYLVTPNGKSIAIGSNEDTITHNSPWISYDLEGFRDLGLDINTWIHQSDPDDGYIDDIVFGLHVPASAHSINNARFENFLTTTEAQYMGIKPRVIQELLNLGVRKPPLIIAMAGYSY